MVPDKKQYKVGDQILHGRRLRHYVIMKFIGKDAIEAVEIKAGKHTPRRYVWLPVDQIKPIGYALIKPSAGGKFRYHTVSWNNEKLQTSQALDDKSHVKRMARKYFPSFHIVDKTV
jgi:hypothetical protein